MSVTFQLPDALEKKLRHDVPNLDLEAKEAYALELFRQGRLTHFELGEVLGKDRFETDAYLKQHNVFEGSLSFDDVEADRVVLETIMRRTGTI